MKTIRVLTALDSGLVSEAISVLLQKEPGIKVVGNPDGYSEIMRGLDSGPDVLILDHSLFDPDELPKRILRVKSRSPRTRVLLFVEEKMPDASLMQLLKEGADGYIRKSDTSANLIAALHTVHAGDIWAERKLLNKFVATHSLPASALGVRFSRTDEALTKREKELVSLLMLGLSNKALSGKLGISETTVKTHLNNIFKKLKVSTRTELVSALMYAAHAGAAAS